MHIKTFTLVAAAWFCLGQAVAQAEEIIIGGDIALPAVVKDNSKSPPAANDPAEPPMKVEVSFGGLAQSQLARQLGGRGGVRRLQAPTGQAVEVATSARGTLLTLKTPGAWSGTANLNFKDGPPPMRFTLRLTQMPGMDLSSLSITSGAVALQVGDVSARASTKYFNARGQGQDGPRGAAYTVTAERRGNGDVDIQVKRGAGAVLGRAMTVSWAGNLGRGRLGLGQAGGGLIIQD